MSTRHKNEKNDNIRLLSYWQVRQGIGLCGFMLPIAMLFDSWLCNFAIQPSISDYYYTNFGDVFVGFLCALGVFFFTYKGYTDEASKKGGKIFEIFTDNVVTNLLGILAISIAIFPTTPLKSFDCIPLTGHFLNEKMTNIIHLSSAGTFLFILAMYSMFYFTKSDTQNNPKKIWRNLLYKCCGIVICQSLFLILICFFIDLPIFLLEAICIWAFGISWIVKGGMIPFMNDDEKYKS